MQCECDFESHVVRNGGHLCSIEEVRPWRKLEALVI